MPSNLSKTNVSFVLAPSEAWELKVSRAEQMNSNDSYSHEAEKNQDGEYKFK